MRTVLKEARPTTEADTRAIRDTVREILDAVRTRGEDAVREYSRKFDRWDPPSLKVSAKQIAAADASLPEKLKESIRFSNTQISRFAKLQRDSMGEFEEETLPGVFLGQKHIPVDAAGCYVPAGRYPLLMSAQMSILTARVAGVQSVVAAAPPHDEKGMYQSMIWSMNLAGADDIFCMGGVQALAAMAYGLEGDGRTPLLAPVDVLVGPGNAYVAEAKRQLFGTVGIDLLAGPTEILIIIDESADPVVVAADLLGQAEHGPTSPAVLVSTSEDAARAVMAQIGPQLEVLPSADTARVAWDNHGQVVVVDSVAEAADFANEFAPEHLEVQSRNDDFYAERLRHYGTLCLGEEATIVYSDKSIGTNHTLPTGRAARYTGGLWVGKFLKTVTYQRCTREGSLSVASQAAAISDAELMPGHAKTATLRIEKYRGSQSD